MFAFLRGKIHKIKGTQVILEVNGVGYRLFFPTVAGLSGQEKELMVYVYLHWREDGGQFYGFLSEEQCELFQVLIGVTGIGPKVALALLAVMNHDQLRLAITQQDIKRLTSIPGIGKKTAQRLVLELQDRLDIKGTFPPAPSDDANVEARLALLGLGYTETEVASWLAAVQRELGSNATTAQLVQSVLRRLGQEPGR